MPTLQALIGYGVAHGVRTQGFRFRVDGSTMTQFGRVTGALSR